MQMTEVRLPVRLWAIIAMAVVIFLGGCGSSVPNSPTSGPVNNGADDDATPVKPPPPPSLKIKPPSASVNNGADEDSTPAKPLAKSNLPPAPVINGADDDTSPVKLPANVKPAANKMQNGDEGAKTDTAPSAPVKLDEWKEQDFLLARDKGDARLISAVGERAKHPRGTSEEAEMLAALVKRQPPAGSEALAEPARGALVRAVTAALAANNTGAAGKSLGDLFCMEFSIAERQATADIVVTALMRQESPENEQTALKILTANLQSSGSSQEEQPSDSLRQKMVAIVRANASARLRKKLANAVLEQTASAALGKQYLPVLCEPNPLNLEAQVLIYQSEQTDNATRVKLEKQFASAGREALETFLGFPAQQPANPPPVPDWHYSVGAVLWGPPFTDFLNLQHQALTALTERPASVSLAAAIPSSVMRANFQRTLSRHWPEGPQAIRAMGVADKGLVEPGFLAVLKSLARENRAKSSQPLRSAKPIKQSNDPEQDSEERPKLTSETDWNKLIEDLVRDYCRRCHMAALARAAAAYRSGAVPSLDVRAADSPVPLQPNSNVNAAYRFDWPDEHVSRLPQIADDVLRVYYLRIEERTKPARLSTYYRRQVKSCIEHTLPDGLWLDGLTEMKKEGRTRSIDVLITRAKSGATPSANEEQELTVEILCIEVPKLHE
jgi:hypothetical protein